MEADVYGDTFTESDVQEEYTETLAPLAHSVASRVSRKWALTSEREDIWSEVMVWIIDHTATLDRWRHENSSQDFNRLVTKSMHHVAMDYASKSKMHGMGYPDDVLAWYSMAELKGLLSHVFSETSWTEPPAQSEEFKAAGDPSTGGNWLATLADISQAINRLSEENRRTLIEHYAFDLPVPEQAEVRARRALHEELGGDRPDPDTIHPAGDMGCEYIGSRNVMTNAQARAVTRKQMGYEQ